MRPAPAGIPLTQVPPSPCAAQLWDAADPPITVDALHAHVLSLHSRFLAGLPACAHPTGRAAVRGVGAGLARPCCCCCCRRHGPPPHPHPHARAVNADTLVPPQPPPTRSHTLVFRHPSAAAAAAVVGALAARGVLADCRKAHVRLGFGPALEEGDVDSVLDALRQTAAAAAAAS